MTEHEQTVEYLMTEYEMTQLQAQRAVEDDDLWLLHYGTRFEKLVGQEALRQWAHARDFAQGLGEMGLAGTFEEAVTWLMLDASIRAEEAWKRAKRRLEEDRVE